MPCTVDKEKWNTRKDKGKMYVSATVWQKACIGLKSVENKSIAPTANEVCKLVRESGSRQKAVQIQKL